VCVCVCLCFFFFCVFHYTCNSDLGSYYVSTVIGSRCCSIIVAALTLDHIVASDIVAFVVPLVALLTSST
jgi:hypothetical protein